MITNLEQDFRDGKTILDFDVKDKFAWRCHGKRREFRAPGKPIIHQHAEEVCDFLEWMKRHDIRRYVEVGVASGGMLCLVDSFLRAHFDGVETHGIDVIKRLWNFEEYHRKYPKCTFELVVLDQPWVPEVSVDLIFIDNNLRLIRGKEQMKRLIPHTKYIAFHDVKNYRWAGSKLWRSMPPEKKVAEIHYGYAPGIGIAKGLLCN